MLLSSDTNEDLRLQVLRRYDILDTAPEETFDRLTRIVAAALRVPIAAVSLVDDHRQWFKSRIGLAVTETPRSASFCAHTMLEDGAMVVTDATRDLRFSGSPLVVGDPISGSMRAIRSYRRTGLPLAPFAPSTLRRGTSASRNSAC